MSETPTNNQLNNWYDKALEIPSFLDTLSLYQKDELRVFTQKKVVKNYSFAVECFSIWKEENYPKGLPREKRIEHILFLNLDTKKPIFVLNLIGWNWTPEKSFYKIEEPQPELKSLEIDIEIRERLINDLLPHFKKNEHREKLRVLFEGNQINEKLEFFGMAKQLIGVFVNIKNGGNYLIQLQNQDIAKWLSDNFNYWHKTQKKYLPIKFTTARNSFGASKQDSYLPDKEDEISSIY